jgi:prevent-host-death family protein
VDDDGPVAARAVSLSEAQRSLEHYVERAVHDHERTVIERDGVPAAILISADDLESILETNEILSDPELMAGIRESAAEIARGEVLSAEEVIENFRRRQQR